MSSSQTKLKNSQGGPNFPLRNLAALHALPNNHRIRDNLEAYYVFEGNVWQSSVLGSFDSQAVLKLKDLQSFKHR